MEEIILRIGKLIENKKRIINQEQRSYIIVALTGLLLGAMSLWLYVFIVYGIRIR